MWYGSCISYHCGIQCGRCGTVVVFRTIVVFSVVGVVINVVVFRTAVILSVESVVQLICVDYVVPVRQTTFFKSPVNQAIPTAGRNVTSAL